MAIPVPKTCLVSLQQRGFLLAVTIVEGASRHQQRLESILFLSHGVLGSCPGVAASCDRSLWRLVRKLTPNALKQKIVLMPMCKYLLIFIQLMCTCSSSHVGSVDLHLISHQSAAA